MKPSPRSRVLALAVASIALVVSACGGGESSAADDEENPYGPLAELFGWGAETPEESRRKQLAMEELIAECMRAEGWEYTPVDHAAQMPDDEMSELWSDPQAFGERYGYGVIHNYEQWEEPYLLGEEPVDNGWMVEDPNWEYVSELSESEVDAYYETLHGRFDEPVWDDEGASVATVVQQAPEDRGCQGQASDEVYGVDPFMADPDLQQRLDDHYDNVRNDARVADAEAEWAACMAEPLAGATVVGTTIARPDQMYQYVEQLKYEAMGLEAVPYREGDDDDIGFYSAWTDETGQGVAVIGEPVAMDAADLERLRALELELWAADQECQDDADVQGIRRRIEAEFADELRRDFPGLGSGSS